MVWPVRLAASKLTSATAWEWLPGVVTEGKTVVVRTRDAHGVSPRKAGDGVVFDAAPLRVGTALGNFIVSACAREWQPGQEVQLLLRPQDAQVLHKPPEGANQFTAQVLDCLFRLTRDRGHSLVLVTHNEATASLCRRVLRLRGVFCPRPHRQKRRGGLFASPAHGQRRRHGPGHGNGRGRGL